MAVRMRSAFTLMELLVVITIIAVLAAMLLTTINMVRNHAFSARCANNLRQLGVALLAYEVDTGRIPYAINDYIAHASDYPNSNQDQVTWDEIAFQMSEWADPQYDSASNNPKLVKFPILLCAFDKTESYNGYQVRSYTYNAGWVETKVGSSFVPSPFPRGRAYFDRYPSSGVFWLMDYRGNRFANYPGPEYNGTMGVGAGAWQSGWGSFDTKHTHPGFQSNALCFDGHSETVNWRGLGPGTWGERTRWLLP